MLGFTDSPFVSLTENAERLTQSKDDDEEGGAKAIAENSKELHTYVVPRAYTWTPEDASNILDRGTERADQHYRGWLSETPTEESEILFLGGNLNDYRTSSTSNPYRKQKGRKGR